jgi:hypothetical protein
MQPAGISWRTHHHPRPTKTEVEVLNAGAVAGAVGLVITSSPNLIFVLPQLPRKTTQSLPNLDTADGYSPAGYSEGK